ncbi:unnamed protein product, partial [Rotaria magnacalcarata]
MAKKYHSKELDTVPIMIDANVKD